MAPVVRISHGRSHGSTASELHRIATATAAETTVQTVGPAIGAGARQVVFATSGETTGLYFEPATELVTSIVHSLDSADAIPTPDVAFTHERSMQELPATDEEPLSTSHRWVSGPAGWLSPTDIDTYQEARGVVANSGDPSWIRDRIEATPLRGRGRGDVAADIPLWNHWETAIETSGEPIVVVNANETTPYGHADRALLESTPLSVLDGALLTARALNASEIIVYCTERESLAIERTEGAIEQFEAAVDSPPIRVATGPSSYLAGEVTMAIEAIEGADRLEARLRPPQPSEWGLNGRPTVVHTPRTLAQLVELLRTDDTPPGTSGDPGTRLLTVAGAVETPITIELPTGSALSRVTDAVSLTGRLKGACVGDIFGGLVRSLEIPVSANGFRSARCGTNGVIELFTHDQCPLAIVGNRVTFAAENNCGRCVTCREGSKQLQKLLRQFYGGDPDTQLLSQLTRVLSETSLCAFGRDAARPIATGFDLFEPEFHQHASGHCPSGTCDLY